MAWPQEFMDEIHDRNELVDVIRESGVDLKQRGRLYVGLCPFHNEKTGSFTVYPETRNFYCFGCKKGGDVITYVMESDHLDYVEAVRKLADRAGMQMPDGTDETAAGKKKRILEANTYAAKFFYKMLNTDSGREARAYIRRRGLTDKTINRFGIGWAPDSWDSLRNYLRSKGFRDEELIEASLCTPGRNGGCYDFFRARVMFPVIDVRGQVVAFSGRTMGTDPRKYLNSKETSVFKKSRVLFGLNYAKNNPERQLILVEGQMDVISLHQAGFTQAVATLGTAITDEHAQIFSKYADEVFISYDADLAGQTATKKAINILRKAGVPTKVVQVAGGKDPDELIKASGPSAYKALLDKASGSMEFELAKAFRKYDVETDEGKVNYLKEAVNILAECSNITEREIWAGRVSAQTGVDKNTILTSTERTLKQRSSAKAKEESFRFANSVGERYNVKAYNRESIGSLAAERHLIAALCENPDFCGKVNAQLIPSDFVSKESGSIYEAICRQTESGEFTGFSSVSSILEPVLTSVFSGILAESAGVRFTEQDVDFFVEKILENKEKPTADALKGMSAEDIMKLINNKKA